MPPLTLHVLPPAFFLPSISPECITAIAFLRYTQQNATWIVVVDAAESPHLVAPYLTPAYHESEPPPSPVEGLDAIIYHLSTASNSAAPLSNSLSKSHSSEVVALSSHLQARLRPLVALSLYVSPQNYASTIKPSLASTLPFPENWILPHQLHKLETDSCAHLGIGAKDLDLLADAPALRQSSGLTDAGPFTSDDAVNGPKSSEKSDPSIAMKIKLQRRIDELVYAALAPFMSALKPSIKEKPSSLHPNTSKARWLFSTSGPTLADLTALSLLSLAILPYSGSSTHVTAKEPALTSRFLSSSINRQFPNLTSSYLLPGLQDAFGGKTVLQKALVSVFPADHTVRENKGGDGQELDQHGSFSIGSDQYNVPWRQNHTKDTWQRIGNAFGAVLANAVGLR